MFKHTPLLAALLWATLTSAPLNLSAKTIVAHKTTCLSPLYVSGNHLIKRTNQVPSLENFINHYYPKVPLDVLQKLMVTSHKFDSSDINKAIKNIKKRNSFNTSLSTKSAAQNNIDNMGNTIKTLRKIKGQAKTTKQLIEAAKNNQIDPLFEFSMPESGKQSLIDLVFLYANSNPQTEDIQSLIDMGAKVTPSAIFSAIKLSNTEVLNLLLNNFDQNSQQTMYFYVDHKGKYNGQYDFINFAATYGTPQSLEQIINAGIGIHNNKGAVEKLLKQFSYLVASDQKSTASINQYYRKLSLLLDSGFTTTPNIAKQALIDLKDHLGDLTPRLENIAESNQNPKAPHLNPETRQEALEYLSLLSEAKNQWPSFVFSYDKNCSYVPASSHYRLDNLISQYELKKQLNQNKNLLPKYQAMSFKAKGDIYLDWHQLTKAKTMAAPTLKLKPSQQKQSRLDAINLYKLIHKEDWHQIQKLIQTRRAENRNSNTKDNNTIDRLIISVGVRAGAPDYMIEQWLDDGAIFDHDSFATLLASPKYNQWVINKLKQNALPIVSHKSVLYHGATNGNIELLTMLLSTKSIDDIYTHDEGVTALTWTLLNYANNVSTLKPQLNRLLKHTKTFTPIDKHLLTNIQK